MTENKRFTISIDSNDRKSLWDDERTEEEPLIALNRFGEIWGIDNVCDLLNEQDATIKELEKENEQLKSRIDDYDTALKRLQELSDKKIKENEQLKQSSTMYHNLFLELQKMMKGVKKASDLDSKDFEDLIELSKGNVFDDELGWIHLPIKEGDVE